ncbi:unnamed protein product [Adineta steineri]|uniref:Death domain-containing protein n=1 Tax=Adineta steineri TaxID=433720 RepID=A0A814RKF5_9BILA|nr:unnamed protein product [Adineta steineri]CAF3622132.1 unnamed protein product [Adineta steineri]
MAITVLDKPLNDLRQEITALRQGNLSRDYDTHKLATIITISRDSLRETELFQKQLLQQLQKFEISLADINEILRANIEQKTQLDQQQQLDDNNNNSIETRAKLMELNAEALECRAAAVQLQQEARIAIAKAVELDKRAKDELAQQAVEMKIKQEEIERTRAEELERRVRFEEEQRLKELQREREQQERLAAMTKVQQQHKEDDYDNYTTRDFMHDDQCPQCIVRSPSNTKSIPLSITFLNVSETENLLDSQEELISTPIQVKFESQENNQDYILFSIPYIIKRSNHRENIIKIRQPNGIWISTETNESMFDAHKEKRFVECKLSQSTACAVVSRLRLDTILINKKSSGRFISNADSRVTLQWPKDVSQTNIRINLRVQPVDLPAFTQFSENFSHESEGLLAVGPIIDLDCDDITLLKPIQFKLPILLPTKKNEGSMKSSSIDSQRTVTNQTTQDIILQQQQSIFKSMLGEDSNNDRLILLYCNQNENTWHIDTNVSITDTKTHDIVTTDLKCLHPRMIIARCDKQLTSTKKIQTAIKLLEQSLSQRSVSLMVRRRLSNVNEICFVCCSSQRTNTVNDDLQQENYTNDDEQFKELTLQEGQLLELRFRGNVLPNDYHQQSYSFAFNTNFPYYFQTNVSQTDKYSQHFSPFFYGFVQIFSKQKVLRAVPKETDKKKQQTETLKQEWHDVDVCLAELVVRLPKQTEETGIPTNKTLPTFTVEGIITPALFRDISASLHGDEWRWLARRLGMTRIRIEAIEHDHHDDASYYMLFAWFKRVPRSTDKVSLLINALVNINRWDLAQDLQAIKDEKRQEQKTSSKDDQLRSFYVPFNRICQRAECIRIWKQIARELMLTNDDIEHIERQYPSKEERCLRSLEHWASNSAQADITNLARIMRSLGFKSLARELDNMA